MTHKTASLNAVLCVYRILFKCRGSLLLELAGLVAGMSRELIAERLKEIRGKVRLSQKAMAERLGIGHRTWQEIETGKNVPSGETLLKINELGFDPGWILTGSGSQASSTLVTASSGLVSVPLLDVRPSAGAGTLVEQLGAGAGPEIVAFREDWLRRIGVSPRFARLMVCQGDSMHDTISDGDLMIVDVSIREVGGSGIYVLVYAGLVIVKRVQVLRDRSIMLKSDNPRYEPETVPAHDLPELSVEGRVRWAGGQI